MKNGKKVVFTWGDKISDALKTEASQAKRRKPKVCDGCGKEFDAYSAITRFCSHACSYRSTYTNEEPLRKKAKVLGANILGGRGKLEFLVNLLTETLGTPCKYCGTTLNLKNISLDHKIPYLSSEDRRQKAKNKAKRLENDRRENLHIVCLSCNFTKGQMTDADFRSLLDWAATRGDYMVEYIRRKLSQSRTVFTVRRGRGQPVWGGL